jgi:DNA-binding SARP family transcriptional activator
MLEVRLLGTFEIRDGDKFFHFSGRPDQSLFAYLILNSGTFHRREKLAALLWPDSSDTSARENLRHVLWRIRKALPSPPTEYLLADDLAIAFNAAAEHYSDVAVLKTAGKFHSVNDLMSVMGAYCGELLPGFNEEWVVLEREYLNYLFDHNMARLMALLQSESRWLDILDWGEHWLAFGQRPEPAYRTLMCAYAEMGEMPKVADTYARCVRSLGELGLAPSVQTEELFKNIKASNLAACKRSLQESR